MTNLEDLLQARLAELKEQTSRAAEILVKHHSAHVDLAPDQMFRFTCTCEHSELVGGPTRRAGSKTDWLAAHQADQLASVFVDATAPLIREAQAEALREAADSLDAHGDKNERDVMRTAWGTRANLKGTYWAVHRVRITARWLRARAAALATP